MKNLIDQKNKWIPYTRSVLKYYDFDLVLSFNTSIKSQIFFVVSGVERNTLSEYIFCPAADYLVNIWEIGFHSKQL